MKEHNKMYKVGKNWVVALIAGVVVTLGYSGVAMADTNNVGPDQATTVIATTTVKAAAATQNSSQTVTPNANFDHNANVNAGCLDSVTNDNQGNLVASGWHATSQYNNGTKHFIIALNADNNREVYRTTATIISRPDVQRVYPQAVVSRDSGFRANIPLAKLSGVNNLRLVSRYTTSANGEPVANGADYWLPTVPTKAGWLDSFNISGNQIVASGWHADDQSAVKSTHFIILFDQTKNHEVGHKIVTSMSSNDVARAYGNILNANHSRFQVAFNITPEMVNDKLVLISRYSDSQNVNNYGNYSDYWYTNKPLVFSTKQAGFLDQFTIKNNQIVASGWHAADASALMPYHYLILWDRTQRREITRFKTALLNSADVANHGFGNIANAGHSRFNVQFNAPSAALGDQVALISRYTDDEAHGEGHHVDEWFNNGLNLNQQAAWTDGLSQDGNTINVTGWHADDMSPRFTHHFLILWDATRGTELTRKEVTNNKSSDVARVHGDILNAGQCRFATSFDIDNANTNDMLRVISRYSDSANGEGHYSQVWLPGTINQIFSDGTNFYDTQGNRYPIPRDTPEHVAQVIAQCVRTDNPTNDLEAVDYATNYVHTFCTRDRYTMQGPYYSKPYGVFIAHQFSCAGATRALGLVLNMLGYSYHHVNENLFTHQWCKLTMDGQVGWADADANSVGYGPYGLTEQS